ncbi:MAG: organic hydroperoxide resistance protein [Christensenellales bacterium]|jgi:osmotically inducible protein OsmC
MKVLYTTKAVAYSGREGKVEVKDSPLAFNMTHPVPLGGNGKGANPEQLFAAGYSACFSGALALAIKNKKAPVKKSEVAVEVSIGTDDEGGFEIAADIVATISGVDQKTADELVIDAHGICPYSKATRGNIEVSVSAVAE